jgi:hypothetical protein
MTSPQPLFIAVERFTPQDEAWANYFEWIDLPQLSDLITLDPALCRPLIQGRAEADWDFIDPVPIDRGLFTSLQHVRARASGTGQILCVFQNPERFPNLPPEAAEFTYVGCDLIDASGDTSSLTNCGEGFPLVFSNTELSENGLLTSFERAQEIQRRLPESEPDEAHAYCDLFVVFRGPDVHFPSTAT